MSKKKSPPAERPELPWLNMYTLDGHTPVRATHAYTWSQWCTATDRHVGYTEFPDGRVVSTVFLGYSMAKPSLIFEPLLVFEPPLEDIPTRLFETILFSADGYCQRQWRCETWEEAEQQHQAVVAQCPGVALSRLASINTWRPGL